MGDLHVLEQILDGIQILHQLYHNENPISVLHIDLPVLIVRIVDVGSDVIGYGSRGGALLHDAPALEDIAVIASPQGIGLSADSGDQKNQQCRIQPFGAIWDLFALNAKEHQGEAENGGRHGMGDGFRQGDVREIDHAQKR